MNWLGFSKLNWFYVSKTKLFLPSDNVDIYVSVKVLMMLKILNVIFVEFVFHFRIGIFFKTDTSNCN